MKLNPLDARQFDLSSNLEKLLAHVDFVVEATSCETQLLWEKHHREHDWASSSSGGYGVTIGKLMDKPVVVTMTFYRIKGYLVGFYEATSVVVDHDMVKAWVERCVKVVAQSQHSRDRHCDANNFHQCLHCLSGLDKKAEQAIAVA